MTNVEKTDSISSAATSISHYVQLMISTIRDIPLVSKGFIVALIFFYLSTFFERAREILVLKPGNTVVQNFYMWNVFTSTYIETHILSLLASITGVVISSAWLLQSPQQAQQNSFTIIPWTKTMYFKFIVIVNFFIGIISCAIALVAFVIIQNSDILYAEYNGFHGCLSGFGVVLKQQLPEQQFSIFNLYTIRGKHIPFITVVIGAIHGVIVGQVTDFLYLILGVYVSWFYLRFFQLHDDGSKGDYAESFSFASFFPTTAQPFVASLTNQVHNIATKIGIVKRVRIMSPLTTPNVPSFAPTRKLEHVIIENVINNTNIEKKEPVTQEEQEKLNADSQRRKELAKRALEKRMASKQSIDTAVIVDVPSTTCDLPQV